MELPFAVDASTMIANPDGSSSTASSLVTSSSQGSLIPSEHPHPHAGSEQQQQQQQQPLHHHYHPHPLPPANVAYHPEGTAAPLHQPQQLQQHPPDVSFTFGTTGDALKAAGSKVSSVLMNFGFHRNSSGTRPSAGNETAHQSNAHQQQYRHQHQHQHEETTIDFAYINVTDEDEVDVWLDDQNHTAQYAAEYPEEEEAAQGRTDVLAILLQQQDQGRLVEYTEKANQAAAHADGAKKDGRLQEALDRHTEAAKLFHEAAVLVKEHDASMANSLLLLSETQAKSALALKRIVKLRPNALATLRTNRLRATMRGALNSNTEADISDSQFLGRATTTQLQEQRLQSPGASVSKCGDGDGVSEAADTLQEQNPVDEMMELERELREMDMALELGNSIASLDARTQNRMKSSVSSESFMVVPGAGSYMSSSNSVILGPAGRGPVHSGGTAGVRARANRVQSVGRSNHHAPLAPAPAAPLKVSPPQPHSPQPQSLESSWWGNSSSTASQILSSSAIAGPGRQQHQQQPANTKQLMRLMDSLRTLGDENAALLREVEDAEAARMEAKAARQQMKRFKDEYGKRFAALKEALEKFRKEYPGDINVVNGEQNPVTSSEFARSASAAEKLQRQEQLIRKLTADLKNEKDESKKKDSALRKYESFYREVKARSAQKAAQRQQKVHQPPLPPLSKQPSRVTPHHGVPSR